MFLANTAKQPKPAKAKSRSPADRSTSATIAAMRTLEGKRGIDLSRNTWGVLVIAGLILFIGIGSQLGGDSPSDSISEQSSSVKAASDEYADVEIQVVEYTGEDNFGPYGGSDTSLQPQASANSLQQSPTPSNWQPAPSESPFLPNNTADPSLLNTTSDIN